MHRKRTRRCCRSWSGGWPSRRSRWWRRWQGHAQVHAASLAGPAACIAAPSVSPQQQATRCCVHVTPAAGPDAADDAINLVAGQQQQLAELQAANAALLSSYSSEAAGLLADLRSIQALLQQLLGECMLREQPAIDDVRDGGAGGHAVRALRSA